MADLKDLKNMSPQELYNLTYSQMIHVEHNSLANGNLVSPLIAKSKNKKLCYELNEDYDEFHLKCKQELDEHLAAFIEIADAASEPSVMSKLYSFEQLSIYSRIKQAKKIAMFQGFYEHGESLMKLLYKRFELVPTEDDIKELMQGYASRQFNRAVDCTASVERICNDIRKGEYGLIAKLKQRNEPNSYRRYFEKYSRSFGEYEKKWYGEKHVSCEYSMKDADEARKNQQALVESVSVR